MKPQEIGLSSAKHAARIHTGQARTGASSNVAENRPAGGHMVIATPGAIASACPTADIGEKEQVEI